MVQAKNGCVLLALMIWLERGEKKEKGWSLSRGWERRSNALKKKKLFRLLFLGSDSQQSFVVRINFSLFLAFLVVWVVVGFWLFFLTDFFVSRST